MASTTARLRELALIADDADALRDALRDDAGCLGAALGVSDRELLELSGHADVCDRVRRLLDQTRRRTAIAHSAERERRSVEAAGRLVTGARWLDAGVELDPRVLLGDLLADPLRPWLGLVVDGSDVVIARARLRRVALALRPFPDVRASADSRTLRLRWREGRGGLNLHTQAAHVHDDSLVLRVVLERPAVQRVIAVEARPTAKRTWLSDVLAEVAG